MREVFEDDVFVAGASSAGGVASGVFELESLQTSRKAGTLPEGLTPLIDREAGARANFGNGVPLAVVLGADGLIAGGPVAGKEQVEGLLADIEEQFAEAARLAEEERQEQMRKALAEGTSNTDGDHL